MTKQKYVGSKRVVNSRVYEAIKGSNITCKGCAFLSDRKECELITVHKKRQMCQANSIIYKLIE